MGHYPIGNQQLTHVIRDLEFQNSGLSAQIELLNKSLSEYQDRNNKLLAIVNDQPEITSSVSAIMEDLNTIDESFDMDNLAPITAVTASDLVAILDHYQRILKTGG